MYDFFLPCVIEKREMSPFCAARAGTTTVMADNGEENKQCKESEVLDVIISEGTSHITHSLPMTYLDVF